MTLRTRTIPASHLSRDPELADWLFESAAVDTQLDPIEILMQREADGEYDFHEEDGVQYPFFAPTHN